MIMKSMKSCCKKWKFCKINVFSFEKIFILSVKIKTYNLIYKISFDNIVFLNILNMSSAKFFKIYNNQVKRKKTWLYYFLLRIPCVIISILVCWFWHTLNYIFWYFLFLWAFLLFIYMVWIIIFSIPYIIIDWFLEKKIFRKKIKAWVNNGDNIDKVGGFVFAWILPIFFLMLVWYDVSHNGWWNWNTYKESNKDSERDSLSNCYSLFNNPFDSWDYIARDWYAWAKKFHECDIIYDDIYLIEEYCENEIDNEECLENTKEKIQQWCNVYEDQRSEVDICIQNYCDEYWWPSKIDIKDCKESLLFSL